MVPACACPRFRQYTAHRRYIGIRNDRYCESPFLFLTFILSSFWTSRGNRFRPFFPLGSCLQFFIAHRVQQSHCSSIFHRVLPTHALALSASQFVHKKKSQRIYTSMHSEGLELTKLTYTRLEDNLIRHRGDRPNGGGSCGRVVQ